MLGSRIFGVSRLLSLSKDLLVWGLPGFQSLVPKTPTQTLCKTNRGNGVTQALDNLKPLRF